MTTEAFLYHPTEKFTDRLEKIKAANPHGHERIMKVIDRLLINPDDADGQMRGPHRGTFKKYVGRSEYRLIYYYCMLCRKAHKRLPDACDSCETIPDRSVVFFDVFHKNESQRLGY